MIALYGLATLTLRTPSAFVTSSPATAPTSSLDVVGVVVDGEDLRRPLADRGTASTRPRREPSSTC